jgi:hypothetical protein
MADDSAIERIEQITGEALDLAALLDTEIARIDNPEAWRLALGFVHGVESRLWRMERDMLRAARDQADTYRGRL